MDGKDVGEGGSTLMPKQGRVPRFQSVESTSGKVGDTIAEFFRDWWKENGKILKAFFYDFLLYALFFVFVMGMDRLLIWAELGPEHQRIHKWGYIACDVVIICTMLIKLIIIGTYNIFTFVAELRAGGKL